MKKIILIFLWLLNMIPGNAQLKDTAIHYVLPDSVQAVSLLTTIHWDELTATKMGKAGIQTKQVALLLKKDANKPSIGFYAFDNVATASGGLSTKIEKKKAIKWKFDNQKYIPSKLLISTAGDSAENYMLCSGYLYFTATNSWKWIGTFKLNEQWQGLQDLQTIATTHLDAGTHISSTTFTEPWCQLNNGSWKNLRADSNKTPMLMPFSNIDSLKQAALDKGMIEKKKPVEKSMDGVYYTMLKEGTGKQVLLSDMVTVFYKGYLHSNSKVFDETKEKPATFPLNRLIKGWQLAVPMCKVGGKIKITIPSGLAYGIRTRAAKIPPNSILVFEVEVVDAKNK